MIQFKTNMILFRKNWYTVEGFSSSRQYFYNIGYYLQLDFHDLLSGMCVYIVNSCLFCLKSQVISPWYLPGLRNDIEVSGPKGHNFWLHNDHWEIGIDIRLSTQGICKVLMGLPVEWLRSYWRSKTIRHPHWYPNRNKKRSETEFERVLKES